MNRIKIKIRKADKEDARIISHLHIRNIKLGFLTKLGPKLLEGVYRFIIVGEESFCYVAELDSKIVGFVAATEDCKLLYKRFFRKNFFWGMKIILTKILDGQVVRKSLDHIFLPRKKSVLPVAEFLTIAVDNCAKRLGVGTKLFKIMKDEFARRSTEGFIVVVGKGLRPSNSFMIKNGGIKVTEFQVHKGEDSNVYFWC